MDWYGTACKVKYDDVWADRYRDYLKLSDPPSSLLLLSSVSQQSNLLFCCQLSSSIFLPDFPLVYCYFGCTGAIVFNSLVFLLVSFSSFTCPGAPIFLFYVLFLEDFWICSLLSWHSLMDTLPFQTSILVVVVEALLVRCLATMQLTVVNGHCREMVVASTNRLLFRMLPPSILLTLAKTKWTV